MIYVSFVSLMIYVSLSFKVWIGKTVADCCKICDDNDDEDGEDDNKSSWELFEAVECVDIFVK